MRSRITLEDIAREVGISKMSVSLALRNDPSVSKETKARVKEISKKLGYIPNRIAKGLVSGKTYTIAALAGGSLHDGYINQILKSAMNYALTRNYTLTAALTESDAKIEAKAISKFCEMMVDGYLIFHCNNVDNYRIFQELKTPFVMYTKYFDELDCDYVVCNDVKGGSMMTHHMIDMGHKRIAFVYDRILSKSSEVVNRIRGYKKALAENEIEVDDSMVVPYTVDFFNMKSIENNTELLSCLRLDTPPTALFACNDTVASALYITLKEIGYKIPEDLSVGGYEGVYLGKIVDPPLTTISSPLQQMGEVACKLLIDKIEGVIDFDTISKVSLEPVLTINNSILRR